jgi:methylmalonyl-CoA mutase cobalamin-binding domain/chain
LNGAGWIAQGLESCLFRDQGIMVSKKIAGEVRALADSVADRERPHQAEWEACADVPGVSPGLHHEVDVHRRAALSRTVEVEIIPRLMLAHRSAAVPELRKAPMRGPITADEVAEFGRLIIAHDAALGQTFVDTLILQGMALETLFLELMAPAARLLGDLWLEDRCSFAEVTVGLGRLQLILSERAPLAWDDPGEAGRARVVLSPAPGEQHTLGMHIVAEIFRKAGFSVRTVLTAAATEVLQIVAEEHVDMVGFSVSNEHLLAPLAALISQVRERSVNRQVVVMVGGSPALQLDRNLKKVGASAFALDAPGAVQYMQQRLEAQQSEEWGN